MTLDTTALPPYRRVGDSDYLDPKIHIWGTLLYRAADLLEETERELREIPGADDAVHKQLSEAMQLVAIVEDEVRQHSVYTWEPPRS